MFAECATILAQDSYQSFINCLPRMNPSDSVDAQPLLPPVDPPLKLQSFILDQHYKVLIEDIHNDPKRVLLSKQIRSFKEHPLSRRIFSILPKGLHTTMNPSEARGAYCFLLNARSIRNAPRVCKCGEKLSADHPFSCKLLHGRAMRYRHDLVNKAIKRAGVDSGVNIQLESRVARHALDRPDITFEFSDGYKGIGDHVCVHTGSASYHRKTIAQVMDRAAKGKVTHYRRFVGQDVAIIPFVTTSHCVIHQKLNDFIDRIARVAADSKDSHSNYGIYASTKFSLIDEILIAIMKGNGQIVADAATYCCSV
jgi:hypothetical protein